jgi:hypothetical protein
MTNWRDECAWHHVNFDDDGRVTALSWLSTEKLKDARGCRIPDDLGLLTAMTRLH